MRQLYTALFYVLLPVVLFRLYWRGIKTPLYRLRWQERLGSYKIPPSKNIVWIHAVSVGETEAAIPLIRLLQKRHPAAHFLVTTTTPTGSARVLQLLGNSVAHVYLPLDLPIIVQRFLLHFQPQIAVIMEKEIWPNLYAACQHQQIPICIINARLSAPSARGYQKIPALIKPALARIQLIATQTEDDKTRFISIGATDNQIEVLGNIKFDISIPASTIATGLALKQQIFYGRFVWIIASSHQDEEAVLLTLYPELKQYIPELLLLIAPRHPERFQSVAKLCEDRQLVVKLRSETIEINSVCDVYLADSMGELKMLYAAADVAFVGGSLVAVGGHNVLEPAAVGTPVMFGPHMFNFQEIADHMLALGAAMQCPDAASIRQGLLKLYTDQRFRQTMVSEAKAFLHANQGATLRIADKLTKFLTAFE